MLLTMGQSIEYSIEQLERVFFLLRRVLLYKVEDCKRSYVQQLSPGHTEGLKEWVDGWMGGFKEWVDWVGLRNGWVGLQKLITGFGRFDTYKGGAQVYEAYEVKKGKITLSFTSPEKDFLYIFMKSLHGIFLKNGHYPLLTRRARAHTHTAGFIPQRCT